MNRYSYEDLLKTALENETAENLKALANWCERYGNCWNGESYDISDIEAPTGSRSLYPVFGEPNEFGDYEIVGYEIR